MPVARPDVAIERNIFRCLDTNGDGTGDFQAIGDYSVTPTDFFIQPASGEIFILHRMLVMIEDSSGMAARDYGNIANGLTNGIAIGTFRDGVLVNQLTQNTPILTNGEWARPCHDVDLKTWSTGNEVLTVRWTFEKSGKPITLNGGKKESFRVTLNDDLTGLVEHTFHVQGYK